MNTLIIDLLASYGQALVCAIVAFAIFWVSKKAADVRTVGFDDDHAIEEESNLAVAIRRAGLYFGLALAFIGVFNGIKEAVFLDYLVKIAGQGLLAAVVLFIARYVTDYVMLYKINNDKHVEKNNTAVALVEFGSYTATGLILWGAFTGIGGGIASALLFSGLGLVALAAFFWIYELITPFVVRVQVEAGNAAAGTAAAGMLIALGVILRAAIAGDFVSWTNDILSFIVSIVAGIIFLVISRFIVDKVFLPHTTLQIEVERDKNVAAVVVAYSILIALAIVVGLVI